MLASSSGVPLDITLLALLSGTLIALLLAYRTAIPYPIVLVVGGGAIGFVPGMPEVKLAPEAVLIVFLPALLYAAAFFSSLRDLKRNARPIGMLAIGLVVATMLAVGFIAHLWIGDLGWAAAFTLGAIVAPTDPVAATAIASRTGAPRRIVTILEGESLVNDATALVAYKFALAAALTGTFSLQSAAFHVIADAVAGVAIGIAIGFVVAAVRRIVDDPPTEIVISLISPYLAYLPAEALGVSAVLAAVTSGIWLGWRAPRLIDATTRIQLYSVWELLTFVLNATLFLLVGLQLPGIVERIGTEFAWSTLLGWAGIVVAAVIGVRMLWVLGSTYLTRWICPHLRARDPAPPLDSQIIIGWVGMRGAVSLAAALAVPESLPQHDLIVFLVYAVILVSLLVEGTTMAPLIRLLGLRDDGAQEQVELKARIKAAQAAILRIEELIGEDWVHDESAERLRAFYEFRIRRFHGRFDSEDDGSADERSYAYQYLQHQVLGAQREEVIRLRDHGTINDEVMRRIERDLDLEEQRLEITGPGGPPLAPDARF